jgi:hypothetical protein
MAAYRQLNSRGRGRSHKRGRLNEYFPSSATPTVNNDCVTFVSQHDGGLSASRRSIKSQKPANLPQETESCPTPPAMLDDNCFDHGSTEYMTMDTDDPFDETFDLDKKRKCFASVSLHICVMSVVSLSVHRITHS